MKKILIIAGILITISMFSQKSLFVNFNLFETDNDSSKVEEIDSTDVLIVDSLNQQKIRESLKNSTKVLQIRSDVLNSIMEDLKKSIK